MAFSATEFLPLSSMANSNAPRHFSYTTPDAKATVVASGYFDAAALTLGLKQGDVIWSVNANGGTETFEMIFVDAVSAAGVVTTLSSTLTLA
jgi:C-terminal processing protease CtpA/Prc